MARFILSAFADEADKMLSGQLEALKDNGMALIELRGVNGRPSVDLDDGELRDLKSRLDDAGVALSALGSPFGKYPIDEPFETHYDAFLRGLDIACALDTKRIRMFSFFTPKGEDPSLWRGAVIDRIGAMLDAAEERHLLLCHENEQAIYGDITSRCEDLHTTFGDRLGCVFDPANFIMCGVKPYEAFETLEPYVTYMHIKDAIAASRAVVPTGKGDGRVKDILTRLNEREGDIILTIEPHLTVFDGLKALQSDALRHEYTYPTPRAAFDAAVSALKETLDGIAKT